jgi:hypothetical protein
MLKQSHEAKISRSCKAKDADQKDKRPKAKTDADAKLAAATKSKQILMPKQN